MPVLDEKASGTLETPALHEPTEIRPAHVWLMSFSVGVIVGNIYYIQPLLSLIASAFRISVAQVGAIAMATQLGVALGMLVFVPLGDTLERRSLIVRLLLFAAICLAFVACAKSTIWLGIACFGVGIAGSTVHVIVPFAAHLAPPSKRGTVVGSVMAGLLFGILLARTFSGFVGQVFGWRCVYWIACGLMLALAVLIRYLLPDSKPTLKLTWLQLMSSAFRLVREQPVLREAAMLGAVFFAAFSAFWTTLIFFLQTPPYHYGSAAAGLFGLVGASGAAVAPFVGRIADRYGARQNVLAALVLTLVSFVVMYAWGTNLVGLAVGVVLMDVGVQAGHISNQTRIYGLLPEARSRLNMVYMTSYFTAGAIGSSASSLAWQHYGWAGVCSLGGGLAVVGLVVFVLCGSAGARAEGADALAR